MKATRTNYSSICGPNFQSYPSQGTGSLLHARPVVLDPPSSVLNCVYERETLTAGVGVLTRRLSGADGRRLRPRCELYQIVNWSSIPRPRPYLFGAETYHFLGRIEEATLRNDTSDAIEPDPRIRNTYNEIGAYPDELGRFE